MQMYPSPRTSRSSAEGQRRASHSLCGHGTTQSLAPCRSRVHLVVAGNAAPRQGWAAAPRTVQEPLQGSAGERLGIDSE